MKHPFKKLFDLLCILLVLAALLLGAALFRYEKELRTAKPEAVFSRIANDLGWE